MPVVLTIAGSDSGGGAGVQADLKTFAALRVFGTTAITCITAQNPRGVQGIEPISPKMVASQIEAVSEYFHVAAAKTGMLYSAAIIRAVARSVRKRGIKMLVVDPVMVATSGARLLKRDAVGALCSELLPLATVITPNLQEAEILWGRAIRSVADMNTAARSIGERFGTACVVKGGHLKPDVRGQKSEVRNRLSELRSQRSEINRQSAIDSQHSVVDVLYDGRRLKAFSSPRVTGIKTHGTGCMFSAALTAFLARGEDLSGAVGRAKRFVRSLLNCAQEC
jgi:hydroxymethylpyrimidine/phosphomethylpyrimidine kinase